MQKSSRFFELIRLQRDSGLSVRAFCSNEGIAPSTFYYWLKKFEGRTKKKDFIPLIVNTAGTSLSQGYKRAVNQESLPGSMPVDQVLFELVYPNGTLIRIKSDVDLAHLRALIHLFD
ncbi:IS66 family insertion sequence element accessory protein TnpB [Bacteroidota bacterium]